MTKNDILAGFGAFGVFFSRVLISSGHPRKVWVWEVLLFGRRRLLGSPSVGEPSQHDLNASLQEVKAETFWATVSLGTVFWATVSLGTVVFFRISCFLHFAFFAFCVFLRRCVQQMHDALPCRLFLGI